MKINESKVALIYFPESSLFNEIAADLNKNLVASHALYEDVSGRFPAHSSRSLVDKI
jgi:hypothetical protein